MIVILAVGPDDLQSRQVLRTQVLEDEGSGSSVVQGRLRHDDGEQQAQGIYKDMPLAAGNFFNGPPGG